MNLEGSSASPRQSDRDVLTFPRSFAFVFAGAALACLIGAWVERDSSEHRVLTGLLAGGLALFLVAGIFGGAYAIQLRQRRALEETLHPWPLLPAFARGLVFVGVLAVGSAGSLCVVSLVIGADEIARRTAVGVGLGLALLLTGVRLLPSPRPKLLPLIGVTLTLISSLVALALAGALL